MSKFTITDCRRWEDKLKTAFRDTIKTKYHQFTVAFGTSRSGEDLMTLREKHRGVAQSYSLQALPTGTELMGVATAFAMHIDDLDERHFRGWEVIPDPSQHAWYDEIEGVTKRAGATPKYVKRRGTSMFRGMDDTECKRYDALPSRVSDEKDEDEGRVWNGSAWIDEKDGEKRKQIIAEQKAKANKETQERLTKEAAKAERERQINEAHRIRVEKERAVETFYEDAGDFGVF